jgi:protein O-GlcNAc transferase
MLLKVLRDLLRAPRPGAQPSAPPQDAGDMATKTERLLSAREYERALQTARHALAANPSSPLLHYQSAIARFMLGRLDEARLDLQRAVELDPRGFDARVLLGAIWQQRGVLTDALASYSAAADLRPDDAAAQGYVGNMQFRLGRHQEAIASYKRALSMDPGNAALHSNLVFAMNGLPGMDRETLFQAHLDWARQHEQGRSVSAQYQPLDPDPERPLRIGYVSADFREHSVAHFIEPVWALINRRSYATCVYDNFAGEHDRTSQRLQRHADIWRRVASLSDHELLQLIHDDRIDILVDLSGHTGGNRLPVFGRRAAPVQVTWLAYMNTTGLASMDYRITEELLAPSGDERFYTETLVRLPCCACFAPSAESPDVNDLPSLANGFTTFLAVNSWTKVSDPVISAWARILGSIPGSRLLMVAGGEDTKLRKAIHERFAACGIEASRLDIRPFRPVGDFLRLFNEADIALDSFPYTGGTTSLHTLWMGVPVVTLESPGETGRCTASYLKNLGLEDLVAQNVDQYCDTATRLAAQTGRLRRIRATLRESMGHSPIMQAESTTRAVEAAFREMWRVRVSGETRPDAVRHAP